MFSHVLDLFLKSPCALCDRPCDDCLCLDCQRQLLDCKLEARRPRNWTRPEAQTPVSPTPAPQTPMAVMSWGHYGGTLKRAIARLKYDGHRALAEPLGCWLGERWQETTSQHPTARLRPVVIPIPLHAEKQQQRGFNQATLIAESFCQRTGLPLLKRGLVRNRATTPQFGLAGSARHKNVSQAFHLGKDLNKDLGKARGKAWHRSNGQTSHSRPVLLLDDIYTSGATAQSACHVIQSAGIQVCGIVTVARAGSNMGRGHSRKQPIRQSSTQ